MSCRCEELDELWDDEAKTYIHKHLEKIEVRADGWEAVYQCPETKYKWLRDFPRGEEHGGGPLRLRRLNPTQSEG
ncbi:MAG: hypothetical protein FKY71_18965 [Spiribacter salinus]|uniref:Uncharacterized protein n=1 Tax=Spiribacter salinus TaxID=1335746 RepID=A0A540V7V5_9GAMM|nr:MAG: hypothetical protein FKY71_18965 [Spiribacter salinus]